MGYFRKSLAGNNKQHFFSKVAQNHESKNEILLNNYNGVVLGLLDCSFLWVTSKIKSNLTLN